MPDKTRISKADSYFKVGLFWDDHDATDFGEQKSVHFDVNINAEKKYISLDKSLFSKIKDIAQKHGVSEETLLNLWIQEKISQG